MGALAAAALAVASAVCLTGCANVGYYWQSATGHLKVLNAAKPVQEWLDDSTTSDALKRRLALASRIREYAVTELHLPDNPSYRRYADLHRSAVVWNVVAAPEYSLTLKTWCFPVTGCVGYRGYFDEAKARAEGDFLASQGWEVSVYPVPAYSTLGWSNWAGGDPLLSTFINYPEGELARLIFHELAHQVLYANGDTMFNESFATAVERIGGAPWLATQASDRARAEYADYDGRRRQFNALRLATRDKLKALYGQAEMPVAQKAVEKKRILGEFRAQYVALRTSWGGEPQRWRGYDSWVDKANNAAFGAQAAYDELVPGFEALFASVGRDWRRFYDAAKSLTEIPKEERHKKLKELAGA
jgi:predicted aminopeptidase